MIWKRMIAGLSAAATMTAFVPMNGFAADAQPLSGELSETISWSYDADTTTLTFSGSGDLTFNQEDAPWVTSSEVGNFTAVVIEDGIESISQRLFKDCTLLTSLYLPDSMDYIADGAFIGCTNLSAIHFTNNQAYVWNNAFLETEWYESKRQTCEPIILGGTLLSWSTCKGDVTIPDTVKHISAWAFAYNPDLTSVVIPDSVTSIGDSAFYWCTNMLSISIPDSVTFIGNEAFRM